MKWINRLLTPDEQRTLLYLASLLLVGMALYASGVYRQRLTHTDEPLLNALAEDTPLVYDLRVATRDELVSIPGVGPQMADNILAWRETHTPTRRSDLLEVPGIGERTLMRIGEYFLPLSDDDTLPSPVSHEVEGPVNINTAEQWELETLPGVGPVLAAAIIAHRPYNDIDDLTRAPGVGEKTLERLRPLVMTGE